MKRKASAILGDLIECTHILAARNFMSNVEHTIASYNSEFEAADPAQKQFLQAAPSMLLTALHWLNFHRHGGSKERGDAQHFEMLVGALIPMVRVELGRAIEYERAAEQER
jgi:hypothetical protein